MGRILVIGATGTVVRQVVHQLAATGAQVRALARNPVAAYNEGRFAPQGVLMRRFAFCVVAFTACLYATPVTTPVEGTVSLPTIIVFHFTGPDVNLSAGTESGRNRLYECVIGESCQISDQAGTDNSGHGINIPYVRGNYKSRQLGLDEPASVEVEFSGSTLFGRDARNGPASLPVDVLAQIQLGAPGTPDFFDLRFTGHGSLQVNVLGVPSPPPPPETGLTILGTHTALEPHGLDFAGDLTEAPEPSTALLFAAGLLATLVRRRRVA